MPLTIEEQIAALEARVVAAEKNAADAERVARKCKRVFIEFGERFEDAKDATAAWIAALNNPKVQRFVTPKDDADAEGMDVKPSQERKLRKQWEEEEKERERKEKEGKKP